jgi:hypothetical protein
MLFRLLMNQVQLLIESWLISKRTLHQHLNELYALRKVSLSLGPENIDSSTVQLSWLSRGCLLQEQKWPGLPTEYGTKIEGLELKRQRTRSKKTRRSQDKTKVEYFTVGKAMLLKSSSCGPS